MSARVHFSQAVSPAHTHRFEPITQILLAARTYARDGAVCALLLGEMDLDQRLQRVTMPTGIRRPGTDGRQFDGLVRRNFIWIRSWRQGRNPERWESRLARFRLFQLTKNNTHHLATCQNEQKKKNQPSPSSTPSSTSPAPPSQHASSPPHPTQTPSS